MNTITRREFVETFDNVIDLRDAGLRRELADTGVSLADLRRADRNGDGVIAGTSELNRAFGVVDSVDHNGSSRSIDADGPAWAVFAALAEGRRATPFGAAIASAARDRAAEHRDDYAYGRAPTSPLRNLSGNTRPDVTRLTWLKDRNKCNQFAGDVLTQAGMAAPTVTMRDGSVHYARAETWPQRSDLFDRITSANDIRVGDIVVRDLPGRGTSSAHIEVVTGVNPMRVTGAHFNGAYEQRLNLLAGATYDSQTRSFSTPDGNDVFVLRAIKREQP